MEDKWYTIERITFYTFERIERVINLYDTTYNMDVKDFVHNRIIEMPDFAKMYTRDGDGEPLNKRWAFLKLQQHADNFLINGQQRTNQFIVFSGLRGIGKTTLLMQLYEYLITSKNVEKSNILYVSVDDIISFLGCSLADIITTYIEDELQTTPIKLDKQIFIFVDEVHFDKKWNSTLKALTDMSKNIFVIATGSSALLLDISTDSARRITKEPLFPLSFSEYQILKNKNFYPPSGTSKSMRDLILTGNPTLIPIVNDIMTKLNKKYKYRKMDMDAEIIDYFETGGFGFTLNRQKIDSYNKLMDLIDRVIKTDLPSFRDFEHHILSKIFRLLGLIALKKSGEISHTKLAKALEMSPDTVNSVLDVLEKTQLIFSIKPMPSSSGVKSWSGSPWKYYFLSPTLTYALRHTIGKGGFDNETKGLLWENLTASTFFRLSKTIPEKLAMFYDRQKGGVDFLLEYEVTGKIIPVEVGLQKDKKQVEQAIKRFNSDYGILISNFDKIFIQDKVIHIPLNAFAFA